MKKQHSTIMAGCFLFAVFFFMLESNLYILPEFWVSTSIRSTFPEEISLVEKYDQNELVIKDPVAYGGTNWSSAIMDIYLKEQYVKFDLIRFREYLKQVYKKAKLFMDKEG